MKLQFNIKNIMVFVGVWAVLNAFVVWVIRMSPPPKPPDEAWHPLLGANIAFAILALFVLHAEILHRYTKGQTASNRIRIHRPKNSRRKSLEIVVGFVFLDLFCLLLVSHRFFRFNRINYHLVFIVGLVALLMWIAGIELRKMQIRRDWTGAAFGRLTFKLLTTVWLFGSLFTILVYKPGLVAWGFRPWFPIPPVIVLVMLVTLVLQTVSVVYSVSVIDNSNRSGR